MLGISWKRLNILRGIMTSFSGYLTHLLTRAFAPARHMKGTYEAFRQLLEWDQRSHELMAALESFYHDEKRADFYAVKKTYEGLYRAVAEMVEHLDVMAPRSYKKLFPLLRDIDSAVRASGLKPQDPDASPPFVLPLDEVPAHAENLAGGKAAHLAAIVSELDIPVPKGFVITSRAFNAFCETNHLEAEIEKTLANLDIESLRSLEETSAHVSSLILKGSLPSGLEKEIHDAYTNIFGAARCAMRSSAVGEDSAFSFAGQFKTVLNLNPARLVEAYKEIIASKYSPSALFYRVKNGFLDLETPMAVLALEMVNSVASGIVYSRSPFSSSTAGTTIYAVWGLGELLVKGDTVPDVLEISMEGGRPEIARRSEGARDAKAVLTPQGSVETVTLESPEKNTAPIDDREAIQLAAWALRLESFFGSPQDIEWCKDRRGRLLILQSRPLGLEKQAEQSCEIDLSGVSNPVLLSGGDRAVSGIGRGKVFVVSSHEDLQDIPRGSILVAHSTPPKYAQVMDRLSAVVTDLGAVAGHFASVAREWGVPTLVNTRKATRTLKPGDTVTVVADSAKVFAGSVEGLSETPCEKNSLPADSPVMTRLSLVLDHCSPLNLLDPQDAGFAPEQCKTLHDIVRFVHEKAVQEMFSLGSEGMRRARGARKLISEIPVTLYVLDLEKRRPKGLARRGELPLEKVENHGLLALWKGLGHPEILWSSDVRHFDWEEFDRLSAGIISLDSQMLASFAVISRDYLNIHIRFGYHFVVIDSLFGPHPELNYILLRFKGGGAVPERRRLRVRFLSQVLAEHGFETDSQGDGIDVRRRSISLPEIEKKLEMLGFLLGFTRLMDQKLEDTDSVEAQADEFLKKFPPHE
jgi:pyruvate, water dikinase